MDPGLIPDIAIEAFERLTGLRVTVHDLHGTLNRTVDPTRLFHMEPHCLLVKSGPHAARCRQFEMVDLRRDIERWPDGRIHSCHAGMVEWVVPVRSRSQQLLAILFAGQRATDGSWRVDHAEARSRSQRPPPLPTVDRSTARAWLEALRQLAARLADWYAAVEEPRARQDRAQDILGFVHRHHGEHPSLGDLARHLGLSRDRTAHVVREAIGRSWSKLLTEYRIATAKRLLATTDLAIAAVATSAGFRDQPHFQRLFRREVGTTPLGYRRTSKRT